MTQQPENPPDGAPPVLRAMRAAVAEHRHGDLDAAIAGYRAVLRLQPAFPEAHNNLGVALKAAGRLDEAAASYRRALELRPRYPAAQANLAAALAALGQTQDALKHAIQAVTLEPANGGHCRVLAGLLRDMRFSAASPAVARAVEACFAAEGIEHQLIAAAALSLLRQAPGPREALARASEADPARFPAALEGGALHALFEDRLLRAVLRRTLVPDEGFERLFTLLRRCCLDAVSRSEQARSAGLFHDDPGLIAALAEQCFIADYAYAESAAETAKVMALADTARRPDAPSPALAVLAMYRPLHAVPGLDRLAQRRDELAPAWAGLLERQVAAPLSEREIAASLARLTPVEDPVSAAVRGQYEANPYPRWLSTVGKAARPLAEVLAELFPHLGPAAPPGGPQGGPTRILVAGCGTGKHAVDVATRYRGAEVLAIDLSLASLAYARRKVIEAGLTNVEFAQADILALDALDRRFDLIEAGGVLHHLAEPKAGWRRLVALLAPGGVMKVGLYSTRARRNITAARDMLRQEGFGADAAGIRAARQGILALPPGEPARAVAGELDFYSLSGCRDLLFNVQERDYTLPEIAAALDELGLALIGFEFVDEQPKRAYAERFPADAAMTDLALWDAFEADNPDTFHNMYQFWCRKAG